jgi:hypothetical protein
VLAGSLLALKAQKDAPKQKSLTIKEKRLLMEKEMTAATKIQKR